MDSLKRARLEAHLATAHRRIFLAEQDAYASGNEDWGNDLGQIRVEIRRLLDDSLQGRRVPRSSAQRSLPNH